MQIQRGSLTILTYFVEKDAGLLVNSCLAFHQNTSAFLSFTWKRIICAFYTLIINCIILGKPKIRKQSQWQSQLQ